MRKSISGHLLELSTSHTRSHRVGTLWTFTHDEWTLGRHSWLWVIYAPISNTLPMHLGGPKHGHWLPQLTRWMGLWLQLVFYLECLDICSHLLRKGHTFAGDYQWSTWTMRVTPCLNKGLFNLEDRTEGSSGSREMLWGEGGMLVAVQVNPCCFRI